MTASNLGLIWVNSVANIQHVPHEEQNSNAAISLSNTPKLARLMTTMIIDYQKFFEEVQPDQILKTPTRESLSETSSSELVNKFTKPPANGAWQGFLRENLIATDRCDDAALLDFEGNILDATDGFKIRPGDAKKIVAAATTLDFKLDSIQNIPIGGGNFDLVRLSNSIHGFDEERDLEVHITTSKNHVIIVLFGKKTKYDPSLITFLDSFSKHLRNSGN
eukprot:TRINITY_DN9250_c0_g1_i2.p2 TRINITY_DN9250_c0_g1~~TRINITY_DN9250_c0_g1_i2.p2  ORF type:complete len:220 (-),score=35.29 TRINITY_DN9250_c0_g1_i2:63-722(-)